MKSLLYDRFQYKYFLQWFHLLYTPHHARIRYISIACHILQDQLIKYLTSLREVHRVCKNSDLEGHIEVIEEFRQHFFNMHKNFGLTMTLKIHIILHHYEYYFRQTNTTFKWTNGEFTESAHSTVRKFEETRGCQTSKNLGTPIHMSKSLRGHVQFNSTYAGSSIPTRIRKKATPSPRVFAAKFKERYPDAVQYLKWVKNK